MMRVKNREGIIIEGLFRNNDGTLCVKNDIELDKYNKQKNVIVQQKETIENLGKEIGELKNLVNSLVQRFNNTEK